MAGLWGLGDAPQPDDIDCGAAARNCGECSAVAGCVWCMGSGSCVRGTPFGPVEPGKVAGCGDYMWRQVRRVRRAAGARA